MDTVVLTSTTRTEKGKGKAYRLRTAGRLPGNLYSAGKESIPLTLDLHQVHLWLSRHTGESLIVDLQVDETTPRSVLLKEVQHHPVTNGLIHVDFFEIDATQTIKVTVPLRTTGTPIGVTQGGGTVDHLIRSLHLECLPGDVVEEFTVDIAHLKIGDIIMVSDLDIDPDKFHLLTGLDIGVVSIAKPRLAEVDEVEEVEGEPGEEEAAEDEAEESK